VVNLKASIPCIVEENTKMIKREKGDEDTQKVTTHETKIKEKKSNVPKDQREVHKI